MGRGDRGRVRWAADRKRRKKARDKRKQAGRRKGSQSTKRADD